MVFGHFFTFLSARYGTCIAGADAENPPVVVVVAVIVVVVVEGVEGVEVAAFPATVASSYNSIISSARDTWRCSKLFPFTGDDDDDDGLTLDPALDGRTINTLALLRSASSILFISSS